MAERPVTTGAWSYTRAHASITLAGGPLPLPDPHRPPALARRDDRGHDRPIGLARARRLSPRDLAGRRGRQRSTPPGDAGGAPRHLAPLLAGRDVAGVPVGPAAAGRGGARRSEGPRGRRPGAPSAARGRGGAPADRPAARRRRIRVVARWTRPRRAIDVIRRYARGRPPRAPEASAAEARRHARVRLPLPRPAPEHAQRAGLHRRQGGSPVAGGRRDGRRPAPDRRPHDRRRPGLVAGRHAASRSSPRAAATTTSTGRSTSAWWTSPVASTTRITDGRRLRVRHARPGCRTGRRSPSRATGCRAAAGAATTSGSSPRTASRPGRRGPQPLGSPRPDGRGRRWAATSRRPSATRLGGLRGRPASPLHGAGRRLLRAVADRPRRRRRGAPHRWIATTCRAGSAVRRAGGRARRGDPLDRDRACRRPRRSTCAADGRVPARGGPAPGHGLQRRAPRRSSTSATAEERWETVDGREIQGWLIRPAAAAARRGGAAGARDPRRPAHALRLVALLGVPGPGRRRHQRPRTPTRAAPRATARTSTAPTSRLGRRPDARRHGPRRRARGCRRGRPEPGWA